MKFILLISLLFFCFSTADAQSGYLQILEDYENRIDTSYWINPNNDLLYDSMLAWHEWELVDNYTFGKDRGSIQMITDLKALHPIFRDYIRQLISTCKKMGIELAVVESFRTATKQAEYFGMGKKFTRSAGGQSKHQYGLACDVVPIVHGEPRWDDKALWRKIGVAGEKLGLRWGGRWRSIYDPAHFEWTGGFSFVELSMGLQPIQKVSSYPCLKEDVYRLKKFWYAWEEKQKLLTKKNEDESSFNTSSSY